MKPRLAALLALLFLVGVAGLLFLRSHASLSTPTIRWQITKASTDRYQRPVSKVTLIAGGEEFYLGTYVGECSGMEASAALVTNELSAVACWQNGGGSEVGVFNENGKYLVKETVIEQPTMPASTVLRGNFKTLLTIDS